MKVLHVAPSLARSQGGLRSAVLGAIRAQQAAGAAPECAFVGTSSPEDHSLALHRFAPSPPAKLGASRGLKRWLREHARDYDAVIAHGLWLLPTRYALGAARHAGVPACLCPHGMLDPDALAHHSLRKRLWWGLGERQALRGATLVFSTEDDAGRAPAAACALAASTVVVPNAVESAWFDVQPQPAQPPRVVCLNRLHPRKGMLELVRAVARLRTEGLALELHHAGATDDVAYARRVQEAGREPAAAGALHLHGLLNDHECRALVAGARVLVHPCVGYENFGMVIAEAMAARVPVVASRRALAAPGLEKLGLLWACEPEPADIARAIAAALADHDAARRVAAAAQHARENYSSAAVGRRWLQVLPQSAASSRGAS